MSLTAAQQEAIESRRRGDVCVVAGPGSGKTRVLVERIRWLVEEQRIAPEAILAITFTKKAAASMKGRLAAAAGGNPNLRQDLDRAWISTIDAFCARLLRHNAIAARVDPDFLILEPSDANAELHAAVDEALNHAWDADPQLAGRFLRVFHGADRSVDPSRMTAVHNEVVGLLHAFRGMGREPFEQPQDDHPAAAERRWALDVAKQAAALYQQRKLLLGRLDFTDLTTRAIQLLQAGTGLPQRFLHILVDENQDTNPLQESLLRNLQRSHGADQPTLFAVGDLNQSIYAFRDAKPEVFRRYSRRVEADGGHRMELLENFRSRPEILAFAEALTASAPGVDNRSLSAKRRFAPKDSPCVEVLLTRSRDPREKDRREAAWIAHRIVELRRTLRISERQSDPSAVVRDREARWGDFAILTRTNPRLDAFAEVLRAVGVPHSVNAGRSFFEAEEVRDLLGFLRLLDNPRDETRLAAALRSPLGGLDEAALVRLKANGRKNLADALRQPGEHPHDELEKLERFQARLDGFRAQREDAPPAVLLSRIAVETGYQSWLLSRPDGLHRTANVAKLIAWVGRADDGRSSYAEIVDRIEQRGGLESIEASAPEEAPDAVRLMTLHAAKGLEFPVVVMASVQAGTDNKSPSLLADSSEGLGGRWKDADGQAVNDAAYDQAHKARKKAQAEEEDRLFYVGMTRAEEHLILSACWGDKPPQKRNGAKRLAAFGVDVAEVDDEPHEVELQGNRIRLFRTWDAPPATTVGPLETERSQPVLVEPAPAGGQADGVAAVTAVSLFADCPRKYYLSRYLGLDEAQPQPDPPAAVAGPNAGELGRQVHEILAGLAEPGDDEAASLARVFSESPLGQRAAQAETAWRERNLLFPIGERLLRGIVDLIFSDHDDVMLVDYKTDRVSAGEARERADRYALQLQLYALALDGAGERPDRAVLYFLRPNAVVDVDLSPTALTKARQQVEEFFAAQESQQFPLKPAPRCEQCPHYQGLCPAVLTQPGEQFSLF